MIQVLQWLALILAVVGLVGLTRQRARGSATGQRRDTTHGLMLVCVAVIISALPRALMMSADAITAATAVSMLLNMVAVVLFIRAQKKGA